MGWLYFIIGIGWIAFWAYWIIAAARTGIIRSDIKHRRQRLAVVIVVVAVFALFSRLAKIGELTFQHQPILKALGIVVYYGGLLLAVKGRQALGSSWGLPMETPPNPKLVAKGPYRYIRHPMYAGLSLMTLGSAVVLTRAWILIFVFGTAYGVYVSFQEEQRLAKKLPAEYPAYQKRTKMFVPYLL